MPVIANDSPIEYSADMKRNFARRALLLGLALVAVSLLLLVILGVTSSREQAQAPGEKSLGVAALGIMFGVPALGCGAAGLSSILISAGVFWWHRLGRPKEAEPDRLR